MILAIDPGPVESAWVTYNEYQHGSGPSVCDFSKHDNQELLAYLKRRGDGLPTRLVIEKIASYGMAVGEEVFETCVWTGRFMQAFGAEHCDRITRHQVKINLCGSARAKDANIRQAVIDRFGGSSAIKKGGPLYKVSGDVWSALAVALTWCDLRRMNAA